MKFIKREKSKENGVIYSVYNGSDLEPNNSVRCTLRMSYSEFDYDHNEIKYSYCYEDVPLSFALNEVFHRRTIMGFGNLLVILEPVKSE